MAARHIHMRAGLLQSLLYWGPAHREDIAHRQVVEEIIDFLEIEHIRKAVVGTLPYGLRKRVELGRALAMEPRLLLLDEPMTGMNQEEKEDMARFILDIHERHGKTILLIEHDMGLVMDIADRAVVLDFGLKIAEGTPEEIRQNEAVIRAYLGEETT
jgi:branched-chain amino acid transport system ATP-binding protein